MEHAVSGVAATPVLLCAAARSWSAAAVHGGPRTCCAQGSSPSHRHRRSGRIRCPIHTSATAQGAGGRRCRSQFAWPAEMQQHSFMHCRDTLRLRREVQVMSGVPARALEGPRRAILDVMPPWKCGRAFEDVQRVTYAVSSMRTRVLPEMCVWLRRHSEFHGGEIGRACCELQHAVASTWPCGAGPTPGLLTL